MEKKKFWSEIDGFPDYKVSRNGEIWLLAKKVNRTHLPPIRSKSRILKLRKTTNGREVTLWHNGKSKVVVVEKLLNNLFPI